MNKAMCGHRFNSYFELNWLQDNWIDAWQDQSRELSCDFGLENTNNTTKSLFKQLSYVYLNHKKTVALDLLILTLVHGLLIHFVGVWGV